MIGGGGMAGSHAPARLLGNRPLHPLSSSNSFKAFQAFKVLLPCHTVINLLHGVALKLKLCFGPSTPGTHNCIEGCIFSRSFQPHDRAVSPLLHAPWTTCQGVSSCSCALWSSTSSFVILTVPGIPRLEPFASTPARQSTPKRCMCD